MLQVRQKRRRHKTADLDVPHTFIQSHFPPSSRKRMRACCEQEGRGGGANIGAHRSTDGWSERGKSHHRCTMADPPSPFLFLQTRRKVGRKSGKENQGSTVVRREEERGGGRGFPSFIGTSFSLFREGPLTYQGWKGRGAVPKEEGEGEQKKLWRGRRNSGFYCLEALQGEREGIQLCKREQ